MRAFRTHIRDRTKEAPRQVALNIQVPLLDVALGMISEISNGGILDHLGCVLLCAQGAQSSPNRRDDAGKEGSVDGVDRYGAIDGAVVGRGGIVDQIVVRIEAE